MASSDVHLEPHRQREQRVLTHTLGLARRESSARRAAVGSRPPSSYLRPQLHAQQPHAK